MRSMSGILDAVVYAWNAKKRWAGHVVRRTDDRWTTRITLWYPRDAKRKIYVPDNFDECSYVNDLAIMELETPVSEVLATPICLPNKFTKLATTLQQAGIGFRGRMLTKFLFP
ncbi:hypothetical protein COOONC_11728 [Cooperia oncophora]